MMQPVMQPLMYVPAPVRARGPRAPGTAVASLVLGVLAVFFSLLSAPVLNLIGLIAAGVVLIPGGLALGLGYSARRKIGRSGGALGGRGIATAGVVLGSVWLVLLLARVALFLAILR